MLTVVGTSRHILRPLAGVLTRTSVRGNSWARVISGPPRVRISFAEKFAHGVVMFVAVSWIPVVVSKNMSQYSPQNDDEEDEE